MSNLSARPNKIALKLRLRMQRTPWGEPERFDGNKSVKNETFQRELSQFIQLFEAPSLLFPVDFYLRFMLNPAWGR